MGECKYWQEPAGINILQDLEKKAENVTWEKDRRKIWYVLFSSSGFTKGLHELAQARNDLLLFDETDEQRAKT